MSPPVNRAESPTIIATLLGRRTAQRAHPYIASFSDRFPVEDGYGVQIVPAGFGFNFGSGAARVLQDPMFPALFHREEQWVNGQADNPARSLHANHHCRLSAPSGL